MIGDSTAFTDRFGQRRPGDERTYPQRIAEGLRRGLDKPVTTSVLARPGHTVREAVRTVTKDQHAMFEIIASADAVVVGLGSFDHAPMGIPPSCEALVPYVRPDQLRRQVRSIYARLSPALIRLRRGRIPRTPPETFDRLFRLLLDQLRGLTQGRAAGVVLGPTGHTSRRYGHRHPGVTEANARQLGIADAHGFAGVAVWPYVRGWLDHLNPDGIHWPAAAHHQIGDAAAAQLLLQLQGHRPTIGLPAPLVRR